MGRWTGADHSKQLPEGDCRADGVLLLVEWDLFGANVSSNGKFIDIVMLVLTGGRERSVEEYGELLASTGFRLNKVVPTASQFAVIEAFPV